MGLQLVGATTAAGRQLLVLIEHCLCACFAGRVSADDVIGALTMSTVLVTVMHSNNEVGSLQPITEIAEACKAKGILCHTDAAQSCGKVSVSVKTAPVDMVTVVGHKFGCPKGVAFLYVRKASLAKPGYAPRLPCGAAVTC